jgi:hypothetical protein
MYMLYVAYVKEAAFQLSPRIIRINNDMHISLFIHLVPSESLYTVVFYIYKMHIILSLIYLLPYFMEQSLSWEVNRFAPS